jgi:hypothetical protein
VDPATGEQAHLLEDDDVIQQAPRLFTNNGVMATGIKGPFKDPMESNNVCNHTHLNHT